jgi:hypothetical protein
MKKDIKVNTKSETVSITVTLSKRKLATDPCEHVRTRDVVEMLKEEGVSFSKEIIKECTVTNEKSTSKHKGTWVFPLVTKKKQKAPTTKKSQSQTQRNTKKTVTSVSEASPEVPVFNKKTSFGSKVVDKTLTK